MSYTLDELCRMRCSRPDHVPECPYSTPQGQAHLDLERKLREFTDRAEELRPKQGTRG